MTEKLTIFDPNTLKGSAQITSDRWIENLHRSLIWIGVQERLPKINEKVIAFGRKELRFDNSLEDACVHFAVFEGCEEWFSPTGDCYEDGGYTIKKVTHWMPLPNAPI